MASATKDDMVARARELRGRGLLWRDVAEMMGVSLAHAHGLATDPDQTKRKARTRARQQTACSMCGASITQTKNRRLYCVDCKAERHREQSRRRARANAHIYSARRRAHSIATGSKLRGAPVDVAAVYHVLHDPCAYCGQPSNGGVDHIVPIASGGDGDVLNLTASCFPCNRSKSDGSLLTFLLRRVED